MPRNAEGGKGGGSDTPGREEEERWKGKTEKQPTGLHNILFKRKLNKNIVKLQLR